MSSQTQRQYNSAYNVVQRITGKDMDYIRKHPESTYEAIKGYEYKEGKKYDQKSIKNLITAILASYKGDDGLIPNDLQEYHLRCLNIFREVKESLVQKTEKKMEGLVAWDEIIKKRDELSKTEYGSRRHLLLSVYSYIPPLRQDLNEVRLYKRVPKDDQGNYIVMDVMGPKMVMNEDNAQVKYGRYEVMLPFRLLHVIMTSLEQIPREYLFTDLEGKTYSANSFTKFSNNALKELFDNQHMSMSLLKTSYTLAHT